MMKNKKLFYGILIVVILAIIGVGLFMLNVPTKEGDILKYECEGLRDGTSCSVGLWYDELGRACGGQSCVGLGLGKCFQGKCVYNEEYENLLVNPQIKCLGSCKCMKECNFQLEYFIPTEEGSLECSVNSINKICCCSGV